MPTTKRPGRKKPWEKPNPRGKSKGKTLSPQARSAARARAKRAGRAYPNLVDNMWAATAAGARGKGRKRSNS